MRRIRLRIGRTTLFLALFVAALIAFLPLQLVLGWTGVAEQGLTARAVRGSMWSGRLTEARFGDVALGDLDARLSPLPLLLGRARIALRSRGEEGPPPRMAADVTVSRHAIGLDDATASVPVGAAFAPLPITQIDLSGVSVRFVDGVCERAEGRVTAVLGGSLGGVPLARSLAGPARCEGGALLLALSGQAGVEQATLRLMADGRYRAELALGAADPAQVSALEAAGFVSGPQGWRLSAEGRL